MAVSMLITILIAQSFGPVVFGRFSYANSIVSMLLLLSNLGIDSYLLKELSHESSIIQRRIFLSHAMLLKLLVASVLFTCVNVYCFFLLDLQLSLIFRILSLQLLLQAFITIRFEYFVSVKARRYFIFSIFIFVLISILKIFVIYCNRSIIYFSFIHSLDIILVGMILLLSFVRSAKQRIIFTKDKLVQIFRKSVPLVLSSLMILLYTRTDQIMLKNLLDIESVGYYSAALKFSEAAFFVPTILFSSLSPWLYCEHSKFDKRIESMLGCIILICVIISFLLFVMSDFTIQLMYGSVFITAIPILKVLSWNCIFVAIGTARSTWIINNDLQKYSPYIVTFGVVVNILLNILLIPIYGVVGAAVASLIAQIVTSTISPLIFAKTRPFGMVILRSLSFNNLLSLPHLIKSLKGNN